MEFSRKEYWSGLPFPSPQYPVPVQSLSHVQLFKTPWHAACQASLSITNCQSLPKQLFTESVMPSNHLILCCPLLPLPSIFPSIRVFSTSDLRIRWLKYWSFSFNISPSNEHPGLISFRMDWLDLLAVQGTLNSLLQGRPRGIGWRGRWEGGSGWGIHVTPWLIHVSVWQSPLKCCEVISLQLIKINEKNIN